MSASFHTSILFSPGNSMLQEMESKCLPHPSHCFYQVDLTLTMSSLERKGYCGIVEWVKARMLSPSLSSCQCGHTIMHGLQNPFGIVSSQNYALLFSPTKAMEDKMEGEWVQNKKKKSPLVLTVTISNVLVHPVLCITLPLTRFISTLVIYVFSSCNCVPLLQSHGTCSSMVTTHPVLLLIREQRE